ncbi:MAG: ABC transporter ATP-binding protein [Spirochaetales bacterium]|nr:ABC transporter ATP-binding protein [Spirochaetales bacterium]
MIAVNALSYRYPDNGEDTLHDLTFTVQSGSVFGFLGPSGSGKSTTQKILMGLLGNYRGAVTVAKENPGKHNKQFYKKIGVGFEFPHFYEAFTARENLLFYLQFYDIPRTRHLDIVDSWLGKLGLSGDGDKKVGDYSKGMKMRLNFGRAVQHEPDILFLDEPTSGLDPINSRKLRNLILEEKAKGRSIFLTTHDMVVADQLCDDLAILNEGRIIAGDTPGTLKATHGRAEVEVTRSDNERRVFPLADIGTNRDFLQFIAGGDVKAMHSLEATLEQVFLNLTGRVLE